MNDRPEVFERELKAILAVEPSSELQPRIRARAFAAPVRRTRWFGLASGLAAAAAMIVVGVNLMRPTPPQPASSLQRTIVKTTQSRTATVEVPKQARRPPPSAEPKRSALPLSIVQGVTATATTTDDTPSTGKIELSPLTVLELTLEPIPQTPVLSIARLEPINIEPLNLTVHNME